MPLRGYGGERPGGRKPERTPAPDRRAYQLLVFLFLCAASLSADYLPAIRARIEHAEREARDHPRNAAAAGRLGMTLHAYQQYEAAASAYSRAHLLDPGTYDWIYLLGTAQMARGEFDAASRSFESALRLRPKDFAAGMRLGQSLTALAAWQEALALYRRVLDEHSQSAQAWYGLGRAQAGQGNHAAAAQSYARACELFPEYGAAHFALARELQRLNRSTEAAVHLDAYRKYALTEPPLDDPLLRRIHELNQSVQVHLQRAAAMERDGNLPEAIREHEAALAIDRDNVQAHKNLISLYGRTGDRTKAKQHFEQAIRLNPGQSDAWYDYGVLLFSERDYAQAEEAFRHALVINPYYAEAHNNLGVILEQQNRLVEAAGEFRAAIENRPDYPLARFHLGRILVNQNKYEEAIQQFLRALEPEDEKTPAYLYALAATCARAGDREHALQYFTKARDLAVTYGQSRLLASIDRDLKLLAERQ